MSGPANLDRLVAEWLAADAPTRPPEDLYGNLTAAVSRTRQHPRRLAGLRVRFAGRVDGVRAVAGRGAVMVAVVALLMLALLALGLSIGSQRRLPPPFGPAANGLMAFDSGGVIYTVDATGAATQRLPRDGVERSAPSWSPDGQRLAYWSMSPVQGMQLGVTASNGSSEVDVPISAEPNNAIAPEWSPDSRLLVFATSEPHTGRIYVADVAARTVRELPDEALRPSHPAWSPDGQWIAFLGVPEGSIDVGLYVVHPDGSSLQRLPTSNIPTPIDDLGMARWSPDPTFSQLLYVFNANGVGDIAIFDVASGREVIVSEAVANEFWPTWSPDGRRIAWYDASEPQSEIRVADVGPGPAVTGIRSVLISPIPAEGEGSACAERPSMAGRFVCQPPQWSPDAQGIYAADTLSTQILVVSANGTDSTRRIPVPATGPVSWQRVAP